MSSIFTIISVVFVVAWLFILGPLIPMFPAIIRSYIFLPQRFMPPDPDYHHPEKYGFIGGQNLYTTTEDGAKIGFWHLLPEDRQNEKINLDGLSAEDVTRVYKSLLTDSVVFLYVHGAVSCRALAPSMVTYKGLSNLNYHVFAFDYRGYGDSTMKPRSETDLVTDTMAVYNWIREHSDNARVFLWGHSLGTGVVSHFAAKVVPKGEQISGIVLEAPFTSLVDVIRTKPSMKALSVLPWFEACYIRPLYKFDLTFQSDIHLKTIQTPLVIMHAKDDEDVPYAIGLKLYENVANSRKDPSTVQMVSYESDLEYGHVHMPKDPNLYPYISKFVEKYKGS